MVLVKLEATPSPWLLPVLLVLLALELGSIYLKRFWCRRLSTEVRKLSLRKYDVMAEIKGLALPTDFVRKSKLERELIQLDKDLAPRKASLVDQVKSYDSVVQKIKYAVYLALVIVFWRTPLLSLDPSATWPLSRLLAFPGFPPGTISVAALISIVQGVMRPVAPWLTSA